jgi:glycosyltransferase involved in cell wall biosynthesis
MTLPDEIDTLAKGKPLHARLRSRILHLLVPVRNMVELVGQELRLQRMYPDGKILTRFLPGRSIFAGSSLRLIGESSLFDAEYYRATNSDLQDAGIDPVRHYLHHGWREGRDPSAAFSTSKYLSKNPDVVRAEANPLLHYLRYGQTEGRPVWPLISDEEAARQKAMDVEVDTIKNSGLFDEPFYRSMYPDLPPSPFDVTRHYCEYGWREGRNPSEDFYTSFYLHTYSDIRDAGINPFWHYVVAGKSELRLAAADFSLPYENDIWFGPVKTDVRLLAFYASPNWTALKGQRSISGTKERPLVPDSELGFYSPMDSRVLGRQAKLAKRHGLYGFCFSLSPETYGSTVSTPVDIFIAHKNIDFRFCVLISLESEDLIEPHVAPLVAALSDQRYILIDDRPVIVVTIQTNRRAVAILRQLRDTLISQGVGRPFLILRISSASADGWSEDLAGMCDAAMNFPTDPVPGETGSFKPLLRDAVEVVPYSVIASNGVERAERARRSAYPLYHTVTLARLNCVQKSAPPLVYTRFHVEDYRRWLDAALTSVRVAHPEDRRLVFVNAWNNWNEGLCIEPDRRGGYLRLNETTRCLLGIERDAAMPKVSVIVPNYNHELFLRRRLDSIYGQTYKNIEVILMDDCSSDQSRSVLDEYSVANPEITRTLYNEQNSGSVFRQWAKGIKAATGDLVWIAESDDYCDERFLETLVRCFDDEAVLLAYSKCTFVDRFEVSLPNGFESYVSDLDNAERWNSAYVATAHKEVARALGIKNTIPNASGVLFKRPIDMPLLEDAAWLSMGVAGDWIFYLHIIRGGKIAYDPGATNFFRRYEGSTSELIYKKEVFYRELGIASRIVATLYSAPPEVFTRCQENCRRLYEYHLGISNDEFEAWFDYASVLRARESRLPNVMVSTMGFHPGGAEILPIRLANEFKRRGLSVLLLSTGLYAREDGVRRMLRNDVPIIETASAEDVKSAIHEFGVEVLNSHQWHIQKYPLLVADVFDELRLHVASLHGMIEHGNAFAVTEEELITADKAVTTWVYTADKNVVPFASAGIYDKSSTRFVKMPNGKQPSQVVKIPRADMGFPDDAFVLCCVSRAIPDKGWAETILVVGQARILSGRDIRLCLVGNGTVYDEYCQSGVPNFVYLAGFSENSVGHYAASDLGVMLTKFKSESFPLTIVDCLFAGKPYIATDVGDIRNMLTTDNGIAGEVVRLNNWEVPIESTARVVAAFATDRAKYLKSAALVPELANRYRIDAVAAQYVGLFQTDHSHRIGYRSDGDRGAPGLERALATESNHSAMIGKSPSISSD